MDGGDETSIKVVIIGESGVGKTAVAVRFVSNTFSSEEPATIMGAYHEADRTYNDISVKFLIWDTAGQERFQSITPLYYRGAQAAVIVYDITSEATFRTVPRWYDQLTRNSRSIQAVVACGNKCDLEARRQVSVNEGSVMAANLGLAFHETSALAGHEVEEVFRDIVFTLFERGRRPAVGVLPTEPAGLVSLNEGRKKRRRRRLRCLLR